MPRCLARPRFARPYCLLALPLLAACTAGGPAPQPVAARPIAATAAAQPLAPPPAPADAPPSPYDPTADRFGIETLPRLILMDLARDKEIHVRAVIPDGPGPFPVIVFSHGAWGSNEQYLPLTELWARHGYVVFQPDHADSRALGIVPGDRQAVKDWRGRPLDLRFLLQSLPELAAREPALRGKLDLGRIGAAGHSAGAGTALFLAGAKPAVGGPILSDPRIKAVVALAPGAASAILTADSWSPLALPMLVMVGSLDAPHHPGARPEDRHQVFDRSPAGDKYLLWVEGMDHQFGGILGPEFLHGKRSDEAQVRVTQMATVAFWDAYLKGSQEAREYLLSSELPALDAGLVTVTTR